MSVTSLDHPRAELPAETAPAPRRAFPVLVGLIGLALLALNLRALLFPMLAFDDFAILSKSWTWSITINCLWDPHCEHAMPLGRLLTYGMVAVTPIPALPLAGTIVGFLSQMLGVVLLYVFVRRELGHPFYGLVAATLFGVTSAYGSCVFWFACSMWMLGLDTMLLALLAAQAWRLSGRGFYLDLCVLACFLAPCWYSGPILAGPFCCLYLLPLRTTGQYLAPPSGNSAIRESKRGNIVGRFDRFAVTPILGTLLFLAVSLPLTAAKIMHTPHYGEKTAMESFHLVQGLINTGRFIIDNTIIGMLGFFVGDSPLPVWLAFILLAAVGLAVIWWLWQASDWRLILLGLAFSVLTTLMILSARAEFGYLFATNAGASRYNMMPQLGLALVVCGGLPGRAGRWFRLAADGRLTRGQFRALCALIALLFVVQLPRGIACGFGYDPNQKKELQALADMEARCRAHHISGDAARAVLPPLNMPMNSGNSWGLLRGSDDPRPMEPDEVLRLLTDGIRPI